MTLLLIIYILLYGYIQPFKLKFVNVMEFAFLVNILLLLMIKSTDDIQVRSVCVSSSCVTCCDIKINGKKPNCWLLTEFCLQTVDFLDVIEYQRGCGKAIKVEQFVFILMVLLLYTPMVVTILLVIVHVGVKFKDGMAYLFRNKRVKKK